MSGKVIPDNISRVRRLVTQFAEDTGLVRFDGEVNAYTQLGAVEAIVYKGSTPLYFAFTEEVLEQRDDIALGRALSNGVQESLAALANNESHRSLFSIAAPQSRQGIAEVVKRVNASLKDDAG